MGSTSASARRLWLLVRTDLYLMRGTALLFTAVAVGLLTILTVALAAVLWRSGSTTHWENFHYPLFTLFLVAVGAIWGSLTFSRLGTTAGTVSVAMLPASTAEKFLAKWLLSTVGAAAGLLLLYSAYALLCTGLTRVLFPDAMPPFNPFALPVLNALHAFLVLQAVFMLGSVWFRGGAFLKTLFVLALLGVALAVYVLLLNRAFLWSDLIQGGLFADVLSDATKPALAVPAAVVKAVVAYLVAPACWAMAYLRFRETEV